MRGSTLVFLLAACSGSDGLPEVQRVDDNVLDVAVYGTELYWVVESFGVVDVNVRGVAGTRTLWSHHNEARTQLRLVAGPEGAVLAEQIDESPTCSRYYWIRFDGSAEDIGVLCDDFPLTQVDGAVVVSTGFGDAATTVRLDLTTHETTPWLPVSDVGVLFATERESYALRGHYNAYDLLRIERTGESRTLASGLGVDGFAMSRDAIFVSDIGWENPTIVSRIPRDGSAPEQVFVSTQAPPPEQLYELAWVPDDERSASGDLWFLEHDKLSRLDDGVLVGYGLDYEPERIFAYRDGLAVLTGNDLSRHKRLWIQLLP